MGEGSGMLVLETLEHALARGATPLAEIVGFGSSADAYRITDLHPEGRGPAAAIRNALSQANIDPTATIEGKPPVQYIPRTAHRRKKTILLKQKQSNLYLATTLRTSQ